MNDSSEMLNRINLDVIESLRSLQEAGEPDFVSQMIDLFLASAPQQHQSIVEGLAQNDFRRVSAAAHSLKSSSANLGAMNLAAICLQVEKYSPALNTSPTLNELVNQLTEEFKRSSEALIKLKV